MNKPYGPNLTTCIGFVLNSLIMKFLYYEHNFCSLECHNKKSKIAAVPTTCSFGGTISGGWWIDSASKRKCCLHSCNFGFFVMSSSP